MATWAPLRRWCVNSLREQIPENLPNANDFSNCKEKIQSIAQRVWIYSIRSAFVAGFYFFNYFFLFLVPQSFVNQFHFFSRFRCGRLAIEMLHDGAAVFTLSFKIKFCFFFLLKYCHDFFSVLLICKNVILTARQKGNEPLQLGPAGLTGYPDCGSHLQRSLCRPWFV